jgi:hypothetical protein
MSKSKITVDTFGLKAHTKFGAYCVTWRRLSDLGGKTDLAMAEYQEIFRRHESELAQAADRTRRHGRADPTGLVILDRSGVRPVFGKLRKV